MSATNYYSRHNTRYVFIDGLLCDTMDKVYATLQAQLSIPDYFGHNLDALEEVLADLEWVEEEKIKIILVNKEALLNKEDAELKETFLSILHSNDLEQLEVID